MHSQMLFLNILTMQHCGQGQVIHLLLLNEDTSTLFASNEDTSTLFASMGRAMAIICKEENVCGEDL